MFKGGNSSAVHTTQARAAYHMPPRPLTAPTRTHRYGLRPQAFSGNAALCRRCPASILYALLDAHYTDAHFTGGRTPGLAARRAAPGLPTSALQLEVPVAELRLKLLLLLLRPETVPMSRLQQLVLDFILSAPPPIGPSHQALATLGKRTPRSRLVSALGSEPDSPEYRLRREAVAHMGGGTTAAEARDGASSAPGATANNSHRHALWQLHTIRMLAACAQGRSAVMEARVQAAYPCPPLRDSGLWACCARREASLGRICGC